MFEDEACLDRFATMLLGLSIAGAAAAGLDPAPGLTEALIAGAGWLTRLRGQRRTDAERVLRDLQQDLRREWQNWGFQSSHVNANLRASVVASFEQVIPHCAPLPAELVGQRLNPEAISDLVLRKAVNALPEIYADPNPHNSDAHLARKFLTNLTTRAYARLIEEPEFFEKLVPALWQDLLDSVSRIDATTQNINITAQRIENATLENNEKINFILIEMQKIGQNQINLTENRVVSLTQTYSKNVIDFESALGEIKNAFEVAAEVKSAAQGDDAFLAKMARLSDEGKDDEAAAEADQALAEWQEREAERQTQEKQKAIIILEAGLRADILRRDPASAARRIAQRVILETADSSHHFESLRAEQNIWYIRGRDQGLNLYLRIALNLAAICEKYAQTDTRTVISKSLQASALGALGASERDTSLLDTSISLYEQCLKSTTELCDAKLLANVNLGLGVSLTHRGRLNKDLNEIIKSTKLIEFSIKIFMKKELQLEIGSALYGLGRANIEINSISGEIDYLILGCIAYCDVLTYWTPIQGSIRWANLQSNLGSSLAKLSTHSNVENNPVVFMATQKYGISKKRGNSDSIKILRTAIYLIFSSLKIYRKHQTDFYRINARMNLGNALASLGIKLQSKRKLVIARAMLANSLAMASISQNPFEWGLIQFNLGNVHQAIGGLDEDIQSFALADEAYSQALRVYDPKLMPEWAMATGEQASARMAGSMMAENAEIAYRSVEQFKAAEAAFFKFGDADRANHYAARRQVAEKWLAIRFPT